MELRQARLDAGYEPVYDRIPYNTAHEIAEMECKEMDARLRDATTWAQVQEALDHVY